MIVLGGAGIFAMAGSLILALVSYRGDNLLGSKKVIAHKQKKEFVMMTIESSEDYN